MMVSLFGIQFNEIILRSRSLIFMEMDVCTNMLCVGVKIMIISIRK